LTLKARITPLNILSALCIVAIFGVLFNNNQIFVSEKEDFRSVSIALLLLVFFMCFLFDQVLRRFVPKLARLWLVQLLVILLTVVLIMIFKITLF